MKNSESNAGQEFDVNCYGTPVDFFERMHKEFNFTLDAAANEQNKKLDRYISAEQNALTMDFVNDNIWLNPPYSDRKLYDWMAWAYTQAKKGYCKVVCLVPASTDTAWWHEFAMKATELRFVKGRIWFMRGEKQDKQPRHPTVVVVFDPLRLDGRPFPSSINARV